MLLSEDKSIKNIKHKRPKCLNVDWKVRLIIAFSYKSILNLTPTF